ncbi:MAG: alpha-ketoacid dehydrogenase subunit beta [Acidimicrobiia bacterium]|nr:alpha-ketoacid dehydrogenase subunit beta [Acidimicrobiia bacterium]
MTETEKKVRKTSFTKALNDALDLGMDRFPEMFLIGEDIGEMGGDFGVTKKLWAKYGGERVRDTPLSEAAIIGTCVGAAMVGMRPVAEIMFADFLGECYDQIVNNAAKVHYMFDGQFTAPLVIRTACGGGFGGGPHHSQSVEGWFMNVPGIVIVAPSNPTDAKGLLLASIESEDPVLFLEHKALYRVRAEVPDGYYTTPLGQAAVAREGSDVTVVATMRMVPMALAAAEQAAADGISVEVVDLRTIRPYDAETMLGSVSRTGRAVVANEAPRIGGLGAELSARIHEECFSDLLGPVVRVDGLDAPIPFSVPLEHVILPDETDISAAIRTAMEKS